VSGHVSIAGTLSHLGSLAQDCFVTVYDQSGNIAWTRVLAGQAGCVAAADGAGNYYVAGDGGKAEDVLLTKLDKGGNVLWSRKLGSAPGAVNDDLVTSVAVDGFGGIYVAGYTSGSMDGTANRGGRDAFLVKFDGDGNTVWIRQFGTLNHDFPSALAADPAGGVYVAGGVDGPDQRFGALGDAMLARYDADGTQLWIRYLDGGYFDNAYSVVADQNSVYLGGTTVGGGGTPRDITEPRQGSGDGFLARLSRAGDLQSVRLLGGPANDVASGVALGVNGDVYVVGYTRGGLAGVAGSGITLARHREATP
jgi:hypothetical protein